MNELFSLKDKNILITGASSGIGRQCAISCSQAGSNVILIGRNHQRLKETYDLLNKGNHQIYSFDLIDVTDIENVIKDAVNNVGKIDGFIHSAGIEKTIPLRMMSSDIYVDIYKVNVISAFEIARILTKSRYRNDKCSFIFIASIMGVLGQSGKIAYSSSKGSLIAGMKSMALELCNKGIRVNTISPAMVNTPMANKLFNNITKESLEDINRMHPSGIGETIDIANACIYLLSDASKWITGTNMILDGGYSAK